MYFKRTARLPVFKTPSRLGKAKSARSRPSASFHVAEGSCARPPSRGGSSSSTICPSSPYRNQDTSLASGSNLKASHVAAQSPSTSRSSTVQGDMRSSLSPQPDSGLHEESNEEKLSTIVSSLENKLSKLLTVLSIDVCAHRDTRKAIDDIVDLTDDLDVERNTDCDESIKNRLDAMAVNLWNDVLALRTGIEGKPSGGVQHAIALLRYSSSFMLRISRSESGENGCPDEVVLTCSRAAIDLLKADRINLAEIVLELAGNKAMDLDDKSPKRAARTAPQHEESSGLYWLARCMLAMKARRGGAIDYLQRAQKECRNLPPSNWVVNEVMEVLLVIASERLSACTTLDHTGSQVEELQEIMEQVQDALHSYHRSFEKSGLRDTDMVLHLTRTLAHMQIRLAQLNCSSSELDKATSTLSQSFKLAVDFEERELATKEGLLLLLHLEERSAALETMAETCQHLVRVFFFTDEHIDCLAKIFQRVTQRSDIACVVGLIFQAAKHFIAELGKEREDITRSSSWAAKIVDVVIKACKIEDADDLRGLLLSIEQNRLEIDNEHASRWLSAIVQKFEALPHPQKLKNIRFLSIAHMRCFREALSAVVDTLKLAIFYALESGQLSVARDLLSECSSFRDVSLLVLDCVLGLKERNEEYAIGALETIVALRGKVDESVLLALLDEAISVQMPGLAHSIMHIILKSENSGGHSVERMSMIRAAIKGQVGILQRKDHTNFAEGFQKLVELVDLSLHTISQASIEDNTNEEKANECDWVTSFLYCFTQDEIEAFGTQERKILSSKVIEATNYRERFLVPVSPESRRIALWASVSVLTAEIAGSGEGDSERPYIKTVEKAADCCLQALQLAQDACDAGHDFSRYKIAIMVAKAEMLLKAQAYREFEVYCLSAEGTDKRSNLTADNLEQFAQLLTEYQDSPPELLEALVKRMFAVLIESKRSADPANAAHWFNICLRRYIDESPSRPVYVDVIRLLCETLLPCLKESTQKAQCRWPDDILSRIITDAWLMGANLANSKRQEQGLRLLELCIDIEAFVSNIPHSMKHGRLQIVRNLENSMRR